MAQRIPTPPLTMERSQSSSVSSQSSSPQLLTPTGTPPAQPGFMSFFGGGSGLETKLHQFLANLDADSRSFCKEVGEGPSSQSSFVSEPLMTKLTQLPPAQKSSVLSALAPQRSLTTAPASSQPKAQQVQTAVTQTRRKSESETRHFDPSREPRLLGLL